jgi:hypothetical protein
MAVCRSLGWLPFLCLEAAMKQQSKKVHRLSGGAIDYDFYRRRAVALRRSRIRYSLRHLLQRKTPLRLAVYAAALCVGLAVGETLPIPTPDCLNCQQASSDIDDARSTAIDGAITIVSRHLAAPLSSH